VAHEIASSPKAPRDDDLYFNLSKLQMSLRAKRSNLAGVADKHHSKPQTQRFKTLWKKAPLDRIFIQTATLSSVGR
jgi:hypothetical protein